MVLLVNMALIIGVYKRCLWLINTWLAFSLFTIVLCAIFIFTAISAMRHKYSVVEVTGFVVLTFIYVGIYLYWWMSVFSLRKVIKLGRPIGLNWDRLLSDEHYDIDKEFEKVFQYLQEV